MQQNIRFLLIGLGGAALLLAGFVYLQRDSLPSFVPFIGKNASSTGESHVGSNGTTIVRTVDTSIPTPSLNRPITIPSHFEPAVAAAIRAQLEASVAEAKAHPDEFDPWLKVGIHRKTAEDYRGAEEVWVYLTKAAPESYIAFNNLGDLYMNFLKDYPKAEANFKEVLTLRPEYIDTYRNLYTMYRSFYKTNTSAAADILEEGLRVNPGNPELLALKAELEAATQ